MNHLCFCFLYLPLKNKRGGGGLSGSVDPQKNLNKKIKKIFWGDVS